MGFGQLHRHQIKKRISYHLIPPLHILRCSSLSSSFYLERPFRVNPVLVARTHPMEPTHIQLVMLEVREREVISSHKMPIGHYKKIVSTDRKL